MCTLHIGRDQELVDWPFSSVVESLAYYKALGSISSTIKTIKSRRNYDLSDQWLKINISTKALIKYI